MYGAGSLIPGPARKREEKTPPHPTPAFPFNVMAFPINVMAFPINVMAFPINGMAPGLAAAPGHGQVALGTKKVALVLGGPVWGPAPLSWPPAPLGHGLAPLPGLAPFH